MSCATCNGEKTILHFYERGPNDPPGNCRVPCPACSTTTLQEISKRTMAMSPKELQEHRDQTTKKVAEFVASQPDPGLEAALRHDICTKIVELPFPAPIMHIRKLVIKPDLCQCGHTVEHHQVKPDRPKGQGCDLCTECTGYQQ